MRLIDAEALMERLPDEWKKFPDRDYRDTTGSTIATMPTINPTGHGKWNREGTILSCSACGWPHIHYHVVDFLYCPHCGARMDEEVQE